MREIELPFRDRRSAGKALAEKLAERPHASDVLVLALPRGGVPVACEVAKRLAAPLDILLVRKLGAPGQPELAAGAIASGGIRVLNPDVVGQLGISEQALERVAADEQRELERRERLSRGARERPPVAGRCVILVDDGIATGATMRAAIAALRPQQPDRIVVAAPVIAPDTAAMLASEADEIVYLAAPAAFFAIGQWYRHFDQVGDDEVRRLLAGES